MNDGLATNILHKGFNGVSFAATSYGLALQFGGGVFNLQSVLSAIAIAAVIQTIVLLGWPVVGRAARRRAPMLFLVMTLVAVAGAITSATFASTTYIKSVREAFLVDSFQDAFVDRATKPLGPITNKAVTLQRAMADYERFSKNEALQERTAGDSCDGANTARICGPICELRAAQAKEAANQASAMRNVVVRIDRLRAESVAHDTQEALIALTEASNAFLRDPTFDAVVDWAAQEKAGFEGRGFAVGDQVLQCRDSVAVTKLDLILSTAQLPLEPASTPRLRAQGYADVASTNLEALSATIQAALSGSDALKAELTKDPAKQFVILWIAAGFVELICALLGLALVPKSGPFPRPDLDGTGEQDLEQMEIIKETYNLCAKYQGNRLYFFAPYDGDQTLRENALLLVNQLPSRPFRCRGPIPVVEVMEKDEAEHFTELTGAKMAQIHIIKRPAAAEAKIDFGRRYLPVD